MVDGRPASDDLPADDQATPAEIDNDDVADGRAEDGQDEPKKRAGCFKVGCLSLLVMALICVLALGGFALYLNHMLDSNIKHQKGMLPVAAGGPSRQADAGDAQNILLLGSDSRSQSLNDNSRSDVIQLVHVAQDRKSIQVVHFPRDMYVSIPGHGKNKINAAYAYGGSALLVQTLQNMLGVKIDHVAQIGFDGFAKVTDELGGVDLYVSQAYCEGDFGCWTKGTHHMTGQQALMFVRERHQLAQGDLDRGRNQQRWINAMAKKLLTPSVLLNPVKLANITDDVTSAITADDTLDSSYIRSLGLSLRSIGKNDIVFYTAPISGFSNDATAGSIDVVDEAKLKTLGNALAHDKMSTYAGTPNTIQ